VDFAEDCRPGGGGLASLRLQWGHAYEITWSNGLFQAVRRDNGAAVAADSLMALRALIVEDYLSNPA
jgi:hypothetical protein